MKHDRTSSHFLLLKKYGILRPMVPGSPTGRPPHRAYVAPSHLAETEQEPLPDHCGELVLGDWDKAECLVKTDEMQG